MACRSTWLELKAERHRPKARYAHSLARMDSRVFLFGGESNTGTPDADNLSGRASSMS